MDLKERARKAEREFLEKLAEARRIKKAKAEARREENIKRFMSDGDRMSGPLPRATIAIEPSQYYLSEWMIVYVAWAAGDAFVKIGKTRALTTRIAEIQTGNPRALQILVAFESDLNGWNERALHYRFDDLRAEGEWFRLEGELLEWLRPSFEEHQREGKTLLNPNPYFGALEL